MIFAGTYYYAATFLFIIALIQLLFWRSLRIYTAFFIFTLMAYQYFVYGFYISGQMLEYPQLLHTQLPIIFFTQAAAYLYFRLVFDPGYNISWKCSLHFLFPVLYTIYLFPEIFLAGDQKLVILQQAMSHIMPFSIVSGHIYILAIFITLYNLYTEYLFIKINIKRQSISFNILNFKDPVIIFLFWLLFHSLILFLVLVSHYLKLFILVNVLLVVDVTAIITFYIYSILFYYFIQLKLLLPIEDNSDNKYASLAKLSENDLIILEKNLYQLMEVQKIYLEADITVSTLAERLGIKSQYLSMYFSQIRNTNFSIFINHYRLTDAKKMLLDEENFPVNRIAYIVGFSSQSNFFETFKKIENTTPTKYRIKHSFLKK